MTLPKPENDLPIDPDAASDGTWAPRDRDRTSSVSTRRISRLLEDGLTFGKYRVVRLIAIGGMSEVYEAVHLGLEKHVALKVMRRDLAETPEARQRFIAEGINAARLQHTNVVDVTDVGEVDELPYLVMNLLEGEDLGQVFDRQGRVPMEEIVDLLLPVASAIAHGHDKGVVHRDLKPDNIFLHREGVRVIPKVLDFGVSRVMSARRITLNASVFGTPHYMSPEQARGGSTDTRTDQYSLGVILYEAVTGHLPRDSSNPIELLHAVAYDSFRPPSEYYEVPPELESVILRAMAHDPNERFVSIEEFALALVPFASEAAREYWTVELARPTDGWVEETSLPQTVRHPSPSPMLARPERVDRTGPIRRRSAEVVVATRLPPPPPPAPRILAVQILPTSEAAPMSVTKLTPPKPRRRERLAWAASVGVPLIAVGAIWVWQHGPELEAPIATALPELADTFDVDVQTEPAGATMLLDGKIVAVGRYQSRMRRDGAEHELRAEAQGFHSASVRFRDQSPPHQLKLDRVPAPEVVAAHTPTPAAPQLAPKSLTPMAAKVVRPPVQATAPSTVKPPVANAASSVAPLPPKATVVDAPAADPHIAVIDSPRPKIRLVDEHEPKIRLVP